MSARYSGLDMLILGAIDARAGVVRRSVESDEYVIGPVYDRGGAVICHGCGATVTSERCDYCGNGRLERVGNVRDWKFDGVQWRLTPQAQGARETMD